MGSDELILMEHNNPCVILEDEYELNDDYRLSLQLSDIRWSDCSDIDSDDGYLHEGNEQFLCWKYNLRHMLNII